MTDQERRIIEMTVELWNALLDLPKEHDADNLEDMRDIHDIQNRVLARATRRTLNGGL